MKGYMTMKIMLVEDDYSLSKLIIRYLENRGYEIVRYEDGWDAIDALSEGFSLFILDIDLPRLSGLEVLTSIRRLYPDLPVIMISATIDIDMLTRAYEAGCSDYLKKPFDIKELALKIAAFSRQRDEPVALGEGIAYNREKQIMTVNGEEIALTPKESGLIALLVENRGRIVSHEQIEMALWSEPMASSHIRQLINRIRKKLPVELIKNRIGEGYIIE